MNANKARDFFSAYYEGTLDRAIRQTFERRLNSDPELQAEYRAFESVIRQLDAMKAEPVEVPEDLHERIAARLDRHVYEDKRRRTGSGVGSWWRTLALGGAACAVLAAAIFALRSQGGGSESTAGVGSVASPPTVIDANGQIQLRYSHPRDAGRRNPETIVVREGMDGKVLSETALKPGLEVKQPLVNDSAKPALMTIEKGSDRIVLVLPGTDRISATRGSGTVEELAKAVAGHYAVSLEVALTNLTDSAEWTFEGTSPLDAKLTVANKPLTLTQLEGSLYKLHR